MLFVKKLKLQPAFETDIKMKFPIKILHFITNSCEHPYLYTVTGYANKDKFEISVGSLNEAGDLQKHYEAQNIHTFSLNTNMRRQFPQAIVKLARLLKKNKIDIIQTHLYDASVVGMAAATLARVPVKIFTGHHSHEMQFYKSKPTFLGDCLVSRLLSDYIIAPTEQMKEIFIKYEKVPADKITVVHHGFDFSQWKISDNGRAQIRKEFNLDNKIVFGAVGKIFWIKDYPLLLKAFAPTAKKHPDAVLMILGTGGTTDLLKLARQLEIEKQIIFTGWRSDVSDLFAAMDVFVHSSLAESFGMVIVEAMAMSKPVVCTDVGIAREIVRDGVNGFLVPSGDQEKFAAALENILKLRARWNEIGAVNQQQVQQFTADKMIAGYESLYLKWYLSKNLR